MKYEKPSIRDATKEEVYNVWAVYRHDYMYFGALQVAGLGDGYKPNNKDRKIIKTIIKYFKTKKGVKNE